MTNYTKDEFVKETGLSNKDIQELKETFILKYAKLKGWNPNDLTTEQLTEIHQQDEYKKGGLLLS